MILTRRILALAMTAVLGFALSPGASAQWEDAGTDAQGALYTASPQTGRKIDAIAAAPWVSLFNGRDLEGWYPTGGNKEAWYVSNGVIECNGRGGGWLFTKDNYQDFIAEIEFKVSEGANSGICIRAADEGDPAYTGMELQVLDDHAQPPRNHTTGAIYGVITPMVNMSRPAGQWNREYIVCVDRTVRVWLNGVKIVDVNLDQHPRLADRVPTGHFGMQDHGAYVWYRNIRIKTLPQAQDDDGTPGSPLQEGGAGE